MSTSPDRLAEPDVGGDAGLALWRAWAVKMLPEGRSPWHPDHSVPPSRTDFPIRPCRHSRSARAAEVRQPEEQILVRPEQHNQQQETEHEQD